MKFLYGLKIQKLFLLEVVKNLNPFHWYRLVRVWRTYNKVKLDFDREDILKVANCLPEGGLKLGSIVLEECADIIRHKFLKLTNQYDKLVSSTRGKFVDLILYLRFLNYDEYLEIRKGNRPNTIMNVVNIKGKIDNKQNLLPLQFITPHPTKDFLKYYKMFNPHLMKASDFFYKEYEARIDIKEMTSHTYITGRNGSGKTELMKSMIFEFLKERGEECSMVVIDPHGDLSEQISRFGDKDKERFVLFDPYLSHPHTPVFNPFDMEGANLDSIAIKTQNLVKALEEVLKGTEFTNQMLTLLESTIPVLLEKQDSNFLELQRFFDDSRNADLVALGKQS